MSDIQTQPGVILFVDDNVDAVQEHRDKLAEKSLRKTYLCSSVDSAVRYLNKHSAEVCLAVIDLYVPINWNSLDSYATKIPGGLKSNHGELLGVYLEEKHKSIPFVYLSAFTSAYSGANERIENVFKKRSDDLENFIDCCIQILNSQTDRRE
ncbi:MAG: hypothetical protein NW204_12380 [Xanthomonadaceae bacterium]|nr:hypothetical protein [Xanthomonadaceae bacterium]